jgi:hypothetical protein
MTSYGTTAMPRLDENTLNIQLPLLAEIADSALDLKAARSGTFVDNMSLPVHRWFRYSAGFAATWVAQVLNNWGVKEGGVILDPFAGSGTVSLVADTLGIDSIGVEAHPVVARICKAKLLWTADPHSIGRLADAVLNGARTQDADVSKYAPLVQRSYDPQTLATLDRLRSAWWLLKDDSPESELVWLALTGILRQTSNVGTAQWQYILPNKSKVNVLEPLLAFRQRIAVITSDLSWMQSHADHSRAEIIAGDARRLSDSIHEQVDAVITSPPYANNYDYADALRFEMTFWGDVNGWGDIHEAVRKYLIVSSSQHSSRERLNPNELLESETVQPIREELAVVMEQLAEVREDHGGKKHYHTMIGAYCRDISLVLRQLRAVCKPGAHMCWVIGDSAPYGVYCPIDKWIGELAVAAGFTQYHFEKLRDRNIKWKNRKHRVPLKEGHLWIEA